MEQPTVLVVVDDLFFLTKIQTTLRHLGLAMQVTTQRPVLQEYVRTAMAPVLVVVDLTLRADDAVSMISAMRATDSGAPLRFHRAFLLLVAPGDVKPPVPPSFPLAALRVRMTKRPASCTPGRG